MGAHLYNKFAPGMSLRLIKAGWLNEVANLWNYAQGGHFINCDIPDNPGPDRGPRWDLDVDALDGELMSRGFSKGVTKLAPNKVNTKNADTDDDSQTDVASFAPLAPYGAMAYEDDDESYTSKKNRIGTSKRAARADHTHPFIDYPASKIRVITGQDSSGHDLYKTLQQMYNQGELGGGGEGEGIGAPSAYTGSASGNIVSWIPGNDGSSGTLIYTEKISKNAIADLDLDQYVTSDALAEYAKTSDLSGYAKTSDLSVYAKTSDVNQRLQEIQRILNGITPADPGAIAADVKAQLEAELESIKEGITEAAQQAAEAAAEQAASEAIEGYSSQLGSQIQDALDAASELNDKISVFSNVDELIEHFQEETSLDGYLKIADAESTYATKEEIEDVVTDDILSEMLLDYATAEELDAFSEELSTLESWADGVDEYHDAMSDWQDAVDADLDQAQEDIASAQENIESIDADVASLDEWSLSIEEWAAGVDADLEDIRATLDEFDPSEYATKQDVQDALGAYKITGIVDNGGNIDVTFADANGNSRTYKISLW